MIGLDREGTQQWLHMFKVVGIERDLQAVCHGGDETIVVADMMAELKALKLGDCLVLICFGMMTELKLIDRID